MWQPIAGPGLCECGCGEHTRIARTTDKRWGSVAGQPVRFVNGHQRRLTAPAWIEEDRGYETPCWVWQRAMYDSGYGAMAFQGRMHNAHRGVYLRFIGPIPDDLQLDHLCRVRACVNPDHMEPVTNAVNIQRGARAKLTPDDVRTIRSRVANGEMQKVLDEDYGVSSSTTSLIVARKTWANIV
jgi:hypothetical protein